LETQILLTTTIARERSPEPNTQPIKLLRFRVRPELTTESSRTLLALLKKKKKATETLCVMSGQFGALMHRLWLCMQTGLDTVMAPSLPFICGKNNTG
jgi:hypothetical protein